MKTQTAPAVWGDLPTDGLLTETQIEEMAKALLAEMTLAEKVNQMSGDASRIWGGIEMLRGYNRTPILAGEDARKGVPGIRFSDGPRGVVMYHSTCFPVSMARGATWDTELEERVGDAIGVEARAQGANFFGGVCINLLRHPAWGRAQETYGEDPYQLGEMGAALVRGVQRHIMACAKHYAANSIENARFKVDVHVDERTLREVYLPHFKRCVDEGVASIMSAYNKVNGEYCGHNGHLLRDILKGDWRFQGFVISDFMWGVREAKAAALGGLDIEMPFKHHYHKHLQRLVDSGEVPEQVIDEAVLRVLRQKIRFAQIGEPQRYDPRLVAGDAHRALARKVAQKSIVLLKNDGVGKSGLSPLPINVAEVKRIAVIGKLAEVANIGDHGSSRVRPPYVVTPLQGIREAAGDQVDVVFHSGRGVDRAQEAARDADMVIVVAGYSHSDEGEFVNKLLGGGDRVSLRLHPNDETLIQAIATANPNTVVVMIGGSAIITEAWRETVPAVVMAWYPGMEGGHAIADVLFGKINPSAKLPCTFPISDDQLPFFDKDTDAIEYGYFHGYRLLDREGYEPAFPFGYGLSYTTFEYKNLWLDVDEIGVDGAVRATVEITNSGPMAGEEVVQLYVGAIGSQVERPVRELKGFTKARLEPGETGAIMFELPAASLAYYDTEASAWVVEPITYKVYVGPSSRAQDLLEAEFRIIRDD
jgi:beta-glucosidase